MMREDHIGRRHPPPAITMTQVIQQMMNT